MSRFSLLKLEERIVLDGAGLSELLFQDNSKEYIDKTKFDSNLDDTLDGFRTITEPNTKVTDSLHPRVLVIANNITDYEKLITAARGYSLIVNYDPDTTTLNELKDKVMLALDGKEASSIAFANHGTEVGSFQLTVKDTVSLSSLLYQKDLKQFWRYIGQSIKREGRIDLLACDLGKASSKLEFLNRLEWITGRTIALATGKIGNTPLIKNWTLDKVFHLGKFSQKEIDTSEIYFNTKLLYEWEGTFYSPLDLGAKDSSGSTALMDQSLLPIVDPPQHIYSSDTTKLNFGQANAMDDTQLISGGNGIIEFHDFAGSAWAKVTTITSASSTFGTKVAISGNWAAASDEGASSNAGDVTLYQKSSGTWSAVSFGNALPTRSSGSYFGSALALDSNFLIVGVKGDSSNRGAAYIYNTATGSWSSKLIPTFGSPGANNYFGSSVAIHGNRAIIGAPNNGTGGAVYIFDYNGSNWVESQRIVAADLAANDNFGASLALSGSRIAVGSLNASGKGAVYIFEKGLGNDSWQQSAKIQALETVASDNFGCSVALKGNSLLVGAKNNSFITTNSGAAYLFEKKTAGWSQVKILTQSSGASNDYLGASVAINHTYAAIGVSGSDTYGTNAGETLLYKVKSDQIALEHNQSFTPDIQFLAKITDGTSATLLDGLRDVKVLGNYAYVISDTEKGLTIFDISNPMDPSPVSEIGFGSSLSAIAAKDNYIYIASSTGNWIKIINASTPTSPTVIATITDGGSTVNTYSYTKLGGINALKIVENYLYAHAGADHTITVIDITNPTSPILRCEFTDNTHLGTPTTIQGPNSLSIEGNYLYTINTGSKVSIINISNPAALSYVTEITSVTASPSALTVKNNYLYVAGYSGNSLQIYDVSNPSNPILVKTLSDSSNGNYLSGLTSITIQGFYAYVSSSTESAVSIINIQSPAEAYIVKELKNGLENITFSDPYGVEISNNVLYVADHNGKSLHLIKLYMPDLPSATSYSLQFDGINDHVTIPHNNNLNGYPLTLVVWVKTTTNDSTARGIVTKYDSSSLNGYLVYLKNGHVYASYHVNGTSYISTGAFGMDGGVINDGKWHQIALSVDPSGGMLFVDGNLLAMESWTGASGTCTTVQPLYIGRYGSGYFQGLVTQLTIFNGSFVTGYYRFDERIGQRVYDISQNKNNGYLGSSLTSSSDDPKRIVADGFSKNYCLYFDGSDDYLDFNVGSLAPTLGNQFTQEMWITAEYTSNDNTFYELIGNMNSGTPNQLAPSLWVQGLKVKASFGTGSTAVSIVTPDILNFGKWNHIAATYNNSVYKLYVNGQLAASNTVGSLTPYAIPQKYLGTISRANYFKGHVADLRLWSTARSQGQILSNMLQPLSGSETNLIAYYPLSTGIGDYVYDSSLVGNIGVLGGNAIPESSDPTWKLAPLLTYVPNHTLYFDGIDDVVTISHNSVLDSYPLSIAVWVKTSTNDGISRGILSKYTTGSNNGYQIYLKNGNIYARYFKDSSNYIRDISGEGVNGGSIKDGYWHHVVFVVDSSGGTIYVDGQQKSNCSWTGTAAATTSTANLLIGVYEAGIGYFNGAIDELNVWNEAKTVSQIQSMMNSSSIDRSSNLVASYRMNNDLSQYVYDYSGNSLHGILGNSNSTSIEDPIITLSGAKLNDGYYLTSNQYVIISLQGYSLASTSTYAMIKDLPTQGILYQYNSLATNFCGAAINSINTAVTDEFGRVVYYPNMDGRSDYSSTSFSYSFNDSFSSSKTSKVWVNLQPYTRFNYTLNAQSINDNTTCYPFSTVTISNTDLSQSYTYTVNLDDSTKGIFTASSITATGFVNNGGGSYSFTGTSSEAQAAIRALEFKPTANQVAVGSTVTTTLKLSCNDGSISDSNTTIVATSIEDLNVFANGITSNIDDNATCSPFSSFSITDPDIGQSHLYTVSLDSPLKGGFTAASLTASGFTDAGSGIYTYTGSAANAELAIRQLVFQPTPHRVNVGTTESTVITVACDDGSTANSTTTINTTAMPSPSLFNNAQAGQTTTDTSSCSPFSSFTITTTGLGQNSTYTITLDDAAKGSFTAASLTTSGFVDMGGGSYGYTGSASAAQAAIRQLVFNPTPNRVAVGSTETTQFTVSSDDGALSEATTTVISTSVNDPSTFSGGISNPINDNETCIPFSSFIIIDPDSTQTNTYTITLDDSAKGSFTSTSLSTSGFMNPSSGTYTYLGTASQAQSAIQQLVFQPTQYRVPVGMTEITTFTISSDDGATLDATTSVTSTAARAPSTFTNTSTGITINDNTTCSPFSTVSITASALGQISTYTVSLDLVGKGSFTTPSLNSSGFTSIGGGIYEFTGSPSDAETAIRQLIFQPTPNRVVLGTTETTIFTVSADDGATPDSTTTVISSPLDQPTLFGGGLANQSVNDNATCSPFTSFTITDPNIVQIHTYTVTIDTAAKGNFTGTSLISSGFSDIGSGFYTYTGTAANAQTAIRKLVFKPAPQRVSIGNAEMTTFTVACDDGSTENTTTVISTAVPAPPSVNIPNPITNYALSSGLIAVSPTMTISSGNIPAASSKLVFQFANGYQIGDCLDIRYQGTDPTEINIQNNLVYYGSTLVGNYAKSTAISKALVIVFNNQATDAIVTAIAQNIIYYSTQPKPVNANRLLKVMYDNGYNMTTIQNITLTVNQPATLNPDSTSLPNNLALQKPAEPNRFPDHLQSLFYKR
jgi:plastocyanin